MIARLSAPNRRALDMSLGPFGSAFASPFTHRCSLSFSERGSPAFEPHTTAHSTHNIRIHIKDSRYVFDYRRFGLKASE